MTITRKLAAALVVVTLSLGAQHASAQVKGDLSDWNVPPPIPPGTIPKGVNNTRPPVIQLPVDIPGPLSQQFPANPRLTTMDPILEAALDVPVPQQPLFPQLPFQVPDIPLPGVPDAMAMPKPTPHDQIIEGATDMPEPAMPDMPPAPKMPDASAAEPNNGTLKLPVIPVIVIDPGIGAFPANSFPFDVWPAPGIPSNPYVIIPPPEALKNDEVKPGPTKKTIKKHHKAN